MGCVRREAPDPERDVSPVEGSGAKRLTLSETLVESKETQDQAALLLPRLALQPGLKRAGFGVIGACPGPRQPNRSSATRVFGALSRVVLLQAIGDIGGHAHRFRDAFAVRLLQAGVPMERVSLLLGHRSIKVTERYYPP